MGGGEDAHIDRFFFAAANGAHGTLLQGAQQLDLHGERQFTDFIEKQGAAARCLEQAFAVAAGAGEAALAMAEEFAFHQLGRDRAAVDRHERTGSAGAALMDEAGDDFLAGAGFAKDEHRRLGAGKFFGLGAELDEGRRGADQLAAALCSGGGRS